MAQRIDHPQTGDPSDRALEAPQPHPVVPPCPDGHAQRWVEILGFRLKGSDYLQLRVVLRDYDRGICHVTLEEHADQVLVRAVACMDHRAGERTTRPGKPSETDCPCNIVLAAPLGDRDVIDIDSGRPLPVCVPGWGRDVPTMYIPRPPGSLWPPSGSV